MTADWIFGVAYGGLAFVAVTNLLLMRRPKRLALGPELVVLIPARNEAANLRLLLPELVPQASVIVFDDESDDGTAEIAEELGARVIRPAGPLPKGWTGKNRACHELGRAAAETSAEWFVFIDADVRVEPDFADAVRWLCAELGSADASGSSPRRNPHPGPLPSGEGRGSPRVITGFPRIIPGRGVEPLFLAWVGWVLLSANPFGIVSRTGMGHNRFTNGQFHVWPREVYTRLQPNEAVKGSVLEDVLMGRLLARERVPVHVVNVSEVFSVRMYDTWRQTLDGMSKNSYEIMGSATGSYGFAALLFVLAWGWLLAPWSYVALVVSGMASALIVRTRTLGILTTLVMMPIVLTIGGYTVVRSVAWRRRGTVVWKGRTY